MDDKETPAKETAETAEVGGDADTDQPDGKELTNEAEFTDTETEGESTQKSDNGKQPQTKEQNSENARRRREAERQKEIQTAKEQAIIDVLGGRNPYTDEEMKDSVDVQEYLTMKDIESHGGDPVADYPKAAKQKEKERIATEQKQKDQDEWYKNDNADFVSKHPEVNISELIADKQFQIFAEGKVGVVPLSDIYDGYMAFVAEFDKKSKQKAAQILANNKATPGALSSSNGDNGGFYTKEQVRAMTQEEVNANYDKIRASMKQWKT